MDKFLVIVESPAKAKTISKYLKSDYLVSSCMGHIIDLPKKEIGIDIKNGFKPKYVIIPKKKKLLTQLKKESKDKEKVYFATDPDREGEAIGWNLKEKLDLEDEQCLRVEFHEITKAAIHKAFEKPRKFDTNKIQAQQARRILDRIVGYFLSPLLWKKISRGLSAGRVQSVALRLVVEREREIKKFVPDEFWRITVELCKRSEAARKAAAQHVIARLDKYNGKKIEIKEKKQVDAILTKLHGKEFSVTDIQVQEKRKFPFAPFITSTLQQDAFNKLGFSATKTMVLAQQLYEGIEIGEEGAVGLITYMRTDSARLSKEALAEVRDFIGTEYGAEYVPEKPNTYKSKAFAQEAHEAIRPTTPLRSPESIKTFLESDQHKLYDLIWKRAIASQMNPARYEYISVDIQADAYLFRASGSNMLFKGFSIVYNVNMDDSEKDKLPSFEVGEMLDLISLNPTQHFTKPPPRYSEGSLVKDLEEDGVGRPSTYAPIIETIVARDYVRRDKGYLYPTELGCRVTDLLVEYFAKIINTEFTAHMEGELDEVENGKFGWQNVLEEFYAPFKKSIDFAKKKIKKEIIYSDEVCEQCGKQMVMKWGRKGKFLSCSDYPRCKFSKSITSGVKCPEPNCEGELIERRSYRGRTFYGCSKFPNCKFTSRKLPEPEPDTTNS